jgi:hypothetical protein
VECVLLADGMIGGQLVRVITLFFVGAESSSGRNVHDYLVILRSDNKDLDTKMCPLLPPSPTIPFLGRRKPTTTVAAIKKIIA